MRGAVLHAPGDIRVEKRPDPTIEHPTDAIIRLSATCICGSDLWPYRGASLDSLLHRFASYRVVHLPRVSELRDAGFGLLPTFGRPHYTVTLDGPDQAEALLAALGKAEPNPYHEQRPGRR